MSGKTVEIKENESLEAFRVRVRKEAGLPELESVDSTVGQSGKLPNAAEVESEQDGNAMKLNLVKEKSVEPEAVEPVVSKAVSDVSAVDVGKLIVKKKTRLFGKSENLEDLSVADLEILKMQKLREEQAEKNRLEDERVLDEMRRDKHEYYETLRTRYRMNEPFEARLAAFFGRGQVPVIKAALELYGLKIIDRKHVFTDLELEEFRDRCKETAGVRVPFDSFAIHKMFGFRNMGPDGEHRRVLLEKFLKEECGKK